MYITYVNHDSVIKQICQLKGNAYLINETMIIHRWRDVTRDRAIDLPFTRSPKSKDVEIVATEI